MSVVQHADATPGEILLAQRGCAGFETMVDPACLSCFLRSSPGRFFTVAACSDIRCTR
jgi:hypothetical protein